MQTLKRKTMKRKTLKRKTMKRKTARRKTLKRTLKGGATATGASATGYTVEYMMRVLANDIKLYTWAIAVRDNEQHGELDSLVEQLSYSNEYSLEQLEKGYAEEWLMGHAGFDIDKSINTLKTYFYETNRLPLDIDSHLNGRYLQLSSEIFRIIDYRRLVNPQILNDIMIKPLAFIMNESLYEMFDSQLGDRKSLISTIKALLPRRIEMYMINTSGFTV